MPSSYPITGCMLIEPTLRHATGLVPPEFPSAWQRFQEYAGQHIPRLPRANEEMALGLSVKLAAQRGIHSPNYEELPSLGAGKRKYALSVHSEGQERYGNDDVLERDDETWVLEYKAHKTAEGKRLTDRSTVNLMNCLEDGIPVGVMVRDEEHAGYHVLGLAYVEQYNELTESFTLHGPVNEATEHAHRFLALQPEELTPAEQEELSSISANADEGEDERLRVFVEKVQRQQQSAFRKSLLQAYEGACAVTDTDVPTVLQAAHIDPYRGKRTQVVTNGILLRADLHLLYDAHLISVEPETHRLYLSTRLANSQYAQLSGRELRLPTVEQSRPDDTRLEFHYRQFIGSEEPMKV